MPFGFRALASAWILGSACFAGSATAAWAEELSVATTGWVGARVKSALVEESTRLVPSPEDSGYRDNYVGAEAALGIDARTGKLRFVSQLRLSADDENDGGAHVDEAYAESLFGDRVFAFAGRRILVWGQSLGLNPSDVFGDQTRVDDVFPRSEARARVEGADMAGADVVFDGGGTLTLLFAPGFDRRDDGREEDLALARLSGFAFGGYLDYAVSAIGGDRPGGGLSLNYAVGEASVAYFDGTFRQGREKRTISGGVARDGSLDIHLRKTGGITPFATVGMGHTFTNGLSANLEYTRDAGGYSEDEMDDIDSTLDEVTPANSPRLMRGLGGVNVLLNHHTLRRNYGFARVAHDGPFGGNTAVELTTLLGLDDGSGVAGLGFDRPFRDRFNLGLRFDRAFGEENTEFRLRPETASVSIYTSVKF